jgi:sulfotransferase
MLVCVRNLLNVFASVEKQHQKNPLLDEAEDINHKTVYNRADNMFSPTGLIGQPIVGIEDLIRRNLSDVVFIQYETFTRQPQMVIERIYAELNEEPFKHDFDNIKNTAEDADGFYLHKYPHQGCGKVTPTKGDEWQKYISPDLAQTIKGRFEDYCQFFGYIQS